MPRCKLHLIVVALTFCSFAGKAQQLSNFKTGYITIAADTTSLDSLSIVPGSVKILIAGKLIDTLSYTIDYAKADLIWMTDFPDSAARVMYRVFPLDFTASLAHKDTSKIAPDNPGDTNPFKFSAGGNSIDELFGSNELNKSGSISRGIAFGNNQDLSVNSTLNLELSGRLTDNIQVLAAVTDDNIPIQPDGNTQQLQDFDQVYIKLFGDNWQLTAGDFQLRSPDSHFLKYHKKAKGATADVRLDLNKNGPDRKEKPRVLNIQTSAAASRGKFARNQIQGVEGNQGPYRLSGAENERFIIVLSGTERVFIDGQLLERGQENDYVIDYNTAEITFTPNQLITKDKRFSIEFQYTDKNYIRSLFQTAGSYETKKLTLFWNIYSEQDLKNQPTQQTLEDSDKLLLSNIGDSLQNAIIPSSYAVNEFTNDRILYTVVDSLGYDTVFVFTAVDDSVLFQVSFSDVGTGNGDYDLDDFSALGRVYKWVAPDTSNTGQIIHNGQYAPLLRLTAPRKQQMFSLGADYQISENLMAGVELAASTDDLNTFSNLNASDNTGYAVHVYTSHKKPLSTKKDPWTLESRADFEYTDANFSPIQRFRPVEFQRNWNTSGLNLTGTNAITTASVGVVQKRVGHVRYTLHSFIAGQDYDGLKNQLSVKLKKAGLKADADGSWLFTDGLQKTDFLRHKANISQEIKGIVVGFRDEHERNIYQRAGSDSLANASYQFYDWQAFVSSADTNKMGWEVFYRERNDFATANNRLNLSTEAAWYGLKLDFNQSRKHRFRINISNRILSITDSTLTTQQPENTLLGRVEYNMSIFKGAVTASTFYEVGSGLEQKREFVYVEVPAGQGIYTWVDYNGDGIKGLNEFEIAAFSDQATYLRVFTPSNIYVRTFSNQFSQTLRLQPGRIWKKSKGIRKALSKFSTQTTFRADRKTSNDDEAQAYNPFLQDPDDIGLLTLNGSIRNSVYYQRTDPKWGLEYTRQQVNGKVLLTSGFESRGNNFHQGRFRWNVSRKFTFVAEGELGERSNASDFLSGRNYNIDYYSGTSRISFQPDASFRASIETEYTDKSNNNESGNERAIIRNIGTEIRYNVVNKGSVLAQFNAISISYTGLTNTSLAFEMLDALQPGINYTWTASWQRNISKNLVLSLNYNGRKSENNRTIHNGGMSVRALF